MSDSSFEDRALSLFVRASDLDGEERSRFLDRECGDDADLRAEVETLIRTERALPLALRTGGLIPAPTDVSTTLPERIGPYNVVSRIGEGGMGIVFRAEQNEPFRRTVAVKVVRFGLESPVLLARFDMERQALALMTHPNIARVLDAGTTALGQPWFAMEFIEGESLIRFCDRNRLALSDRLRLFIQVCRGVQHAHRNTIIHRDLKPSNLLVAIEDGKPVPKVIDFGIAKSVDGNPPGETPKTSHGDLLGTPEYMSPEQLSLGSPEVDTRTDVYSLGVILYELVTGGHPFVAERPSRLLPGELRRRIRELDPVRPSTRVRRATPVPSVGRRETATLARSLRGDLDWITLKALEKDPDRRYESPAELARDLERHLDHRPVAAGPPNPVYQVGLFVRRHRTAATLGALALALAASVAVARLQSRSAARMSELVYEMFDANDVQRSDSLNPLSMLHHWAATARGQLPRDSVDRAKALHNLSVFAEWWVRDATFAIELESEAHQIFQDQLGPRSASALMSKRSLARLQQSVGRLDRAEELFRSVLEVRRSIDGTDLDAIGARTDLGLFYSRTGRSREGGPLLLEASNLLNGRFGPNHPQTIRVDGYLAAAWLGADRRDEGRALLSSVLERVGSHPELEDVRRMATYNLALQLAHEGDRDLGMEHLKRALEMGFSPGNDPGLDLFRSHADFGDVRRMIEFNQSDLWSEKVIDARVARRAGDPDTAARIYADVIAASDRKTSVTHPQAVQAAMGLLEIYVRERRCEDAASLFPRLLESMREQGSIDPWRIADLHWDWAGCSLLLGDLAETNRHMDRAGELYEATDQEHASSLYYRAARLAQDGERAAGLAALARAIESGADNFEYIKKDPLLGPLHGKEFERMVGSTVVSGAD